MSIANPLIDNYDIPRFERIQPQHFKDAVLQAIKETYETVEQLEKNAQPVWDDIYIPLENIARKFDCSWGVAGHLLAVQNSEDLRKVYDELQGKVVEVGLRMAQSEPIYRKLTQIKEAKEWQKLSLAQKRIIERYILDAKLSGIELKGKEKEEFNEISKKSAKLSTDFANNVLDATKEFSLDITDRSQMEGMPPDYLEMAARTYNRLTKTEKATPEKGPWRITLDIPSYMPFQQHNKNRELRKQLYLGSIQKASAGKHNNEAIIYELLNLRRREAQLLGYNTFAELSIAAKMAPGVEQVEDLLKRLCAASRPHAIKEYEHLKKFAKANGVEDFQHWDVAYFSERLKEQNFGLKDEVLKQYFPLETVLKGLFDLVEKLFEIRVAPGKGDISTWHTDVRFFNLFNRSGKQVASFYLDPYSRPENKKGGAWMNTCVNRGWVKGQLLDPVAYIICNGTPPIGDKPSLLTFREVETLFHEFGHALQHMLTQVDFYHAAGIHGIEWDAVELPSQFMENWVYYKPTLLQIARHYKTNEPLPDDLIEKLFAAKNFQSGLQMVRQLYLGMTDLELHHRYDPKTKDKQSVFDIGRDIASKTLVVPPHEKDRFLCSFSHIFSGGYAAGYYSYKWAEVLSADAFSAFEEIGLEKQEEVKKMGTRFRDTILSLGGSVHPSDVFRDFRGRDPVIEPLLQHSGISTHA
ncbi:MAG: M3 family metallopeptidase [Oligoflexales bacterium]